MSWIIVTDSGRLAVHGAGCWNSPEASHDRWRKALDAIRARRSYYSDWLLVRPKEDATEIWNPFESEGGHDLIRIPSCETEEFCAAVEKALEAGALMLPREYEHD